MSYPHSEILYWSKATARKAFDMLTVRIKTQCGKGAISRLEEDLGFKPDWFRGHRKPGRTITLEHLLACLKWADIEPEVFFKELLLKNTTDLVERDQPEQANDIIRLVLERRAVPIDGRIIPSHWHRAAADADRVRFLDPISALSRLMQVLEVQQPPPEFRSRLLAVAGSCYRSVYATTDALACLRKAKDLASTPLEYGDSLQRLLYCYKLQEPERAFELGREALFVYSRINNRTKIAECLVDLATVYFSTYQMESARDLYLDVCKNHFPELSQFSRVSAAQGLATTFAQLGKAEDAMNWIRVAEEHLYGTSHPYHNYTHAHLAWCRGLALSDLPDIKEAISNFGKEHFFEASTATIDFIKLALKKNEKDSALQAAAEVLALAPQKSAIKPIFQNIVASLELNRPLIWQKILKNLSRARERSLRSLLQQKLNGSSLDNIQK